MSLSFTCPICGQTHEGFAALTFKAPAPWEWATEEAREAEWVLQSDFCRFKAVDFYVRAVLVLPIIGSDQTLEFGVWSTLSKANIDRYWDSFEDDDQSKLGPMFGWFSNALPGYPETMGLKCQVLPRDDRQRPIIERNRATIRWRSTSGTASRWRKRPDTTTPTSYGPDARLKRNIIVLLPRIALLLPLQRP